mgnify:CR=1 FL=1
MSDRPPVPEPTLVPVLADLHLAAARHTTVDDLPQGLRDSILQRHHVSRSAFDASLAYYAARPEDFKTLYESVVDTLSAAHADLRNPRPKRPAPTSRDSLRSNH